MASTEWLISFLALLGMESAFRCLTSLWPATGAAEAFIIALTDASMETQLAGFVAVSSLALILIRLATFSFNRYMAGKHRRAGSQN